MSKARSPRLPSSMTVGMKTCCSRSGRLFVVGLMVLLHLRMSACGSLGCFSSYIKYEIMRAP